MSCQISRHYHAESQLPAPRYRVLLAEDDAAMRTMVADALRRDGHLVRELRSGGELLSELASELLHERSLEMADLIVSDVRMPGVTGLEVLAGLRHAHWATPFILITAFGDAATHAEAHRLGAAVFDKPFDLADLRTAVFNLARPSESSAPIRKAP
jgi:DNA-binding response OmpR family regulator